MASQTQIHRNGVPNEQFVKFQALSTATTQTKATDVFVLTGANGDLTLSADALAERHLYIATANNAGASLIPPSGYTVLGYEPDGTALDVNGITGSVAGGWSVIFMADKENSRLIVIGGANYLGIA